MKRLSILIGLTLGLAVYAWAAMHVARGQGVVEGGSQDGAHFEFRVVMPENPSHPNRFRFWDHGMFIPVDIVMPRVERVRFEHHAVHFVGRGWYNQSTPVHVAVSAFDGGLHHPDRFRMVARNRDGVVVHSAEGELLEGDIIIGHRQ
jgi:hypothetical protein